MRILLISVLTTTLIGCASVAPPNAITYECRPCEPAAPQLDPKPVVFKADADAKNAKPTVAATTHFPSVLLGKKTNPVAKRATYTIAAKAKPLSSAQLDDKADPVIEKAKATIAAMMENPASAVFGELRRAVRTVRGDPIDHICGYVKGKNASGGDTGKIPFLYIIQHDEAYIVDGSGEELAATAYRNFCN